ncbi:hypothetical protein D5872_24835 [Salmonella enterica subsp. enterica serovar Birkenhead]|nr:hypothetical protein [Salmonella enterica subsp. enterica serovar Thompson]EBY7195557.1 hypothetical protein [Salmonella enterica subsp. enterica serovar Birkenhead]ECY7950029.1 hypothetical protein [Salmonella enterica subsp. enterica serovar Thompson]EHI8891572.1 hypothetical protein [Salmonella enterica]
MRDTYTTSSVDPVQLHNTGHAIFNADFSAFFQISAVFTDNFSHKYRAAFLMTPVLLRYVSAVTDRQDFASGFLCIPGMLFTAIGVDGL